MAKLKSERVSFK